MLHVCSFLCRFTWLSIVMLQDYRTAVCPFIDVVDYNNMEYRAQDEGARGAFDWQLYYKRQVPCVRQERLLCPSRTYVNIHL
jgi:hypothetical protein